MAPTPSASPDAIASRIPDPTRDPELVATEARNLAELEGIFGSAIQGPAAGASGGIGSAGLPGVTFHSRTVEAGTYTVTAACVGAPSAQLVVRQDPVHGGSVLDLTFDCATATQHDVTMVGGPVSAHVFRYSAGSDPSPGAVAGVRLRMARPAP